MQGMNAALIDSIAACGDVNRNVMASANPVESQLHAGSARVGGEALRASEAAARARITRSGSTARSSSAPREEEPLLRPGSIYRASSRPPWSCRRTTTSTCSRRISASSPSWTSETPRQLLGFNLTVGGGLGATHGEPQTFPRVADVIGFLTPDQMLKVAETVLMIQRDFGDRTRSQARAPQVHDRRSRRRLVQGRAVPAPGLRARSRRAPYKFTTQGDRFGWLRGHDGRWHLTLRIESGRVVDRAGAAFLTGLEKIAAIHKGDFRLTAEPEPDHRQRAGRPSA